MLKNRGVMLILIGMIFLLNACGGGGGSGSDGSGVSSGTGKVSVLVTDDLSTDFRKAWITIQRVSVMSEGNAEYILFDDPTGRIFNLLELSGIGSLLNTTTVPAGTYKTIRVTMKNEVVLVDKGGNTINAKLAPQGSQYSLDVNGNLVVTEGQNTSLWLDFDTKQFNYNPQSGIVTVIVVFKQESEMSSVHEYAEIKGSVTEIASPTSFYLVPSYSNSTTLTVVLHPSAVVYNEATGATSTNTTIISPGNKVEVYGYYDSSTLTITAISVKIKKSGTEIPGYVKAEGYITAINGDIVTLDVRKAEHFVPPSTTISIDISVAGFSKGNKSMLGNGMWIEVKGMWDGTILKASLVEIEGAKSGGDLDNSYVEVKGVITNVSGNTITVSAREYEHFKSPPPNPLTVDVSQAFFKHGGTNNLVTGAYVEVKGTWDGSLLKATVVEFKNEDDD